MAAAAALTPSSQAASITAQLDCNINVLNDTGSCGGTSFGSVKIDDSIGGGKVTLSVNLGAGLKFKDMLLAFDGPGSIVSIVDTNDANNTVSYDPDGFAGIGPNGAIGAFDVGDSTDPGSGWNGNSGYSVILMANEALTLDYFLGALDTNEKVSVVMHIQSIGPGNCSTPSTCTPGTVGTGSLFQGGTFERDADVPDVPEPSTMFLMGGSLLALAYFRKRRNS